MDPEGAGIAQQWFNAELPETISLPTTTEEAGLGPHNTKRERARLTRIRAFVGPAWYQKKVAVPASGAGKLLVCAIDLPSLQGKPEGRQMLRSLLDYVKSEAFAPKFELGEATLSRLPAAGSE